MRGQCLVETISKNAPNYLPAFVRQDSKNFIKLHISAFSTFKNEEIICAAFSVNPHPEKFKTRRSLIVRIAGARMKIPESPMLHLLNDRYLILLLFPIPFANTRRAASRNWMPETSKTCK